MDFRCVNCEAGVKYLSMIFISSVISVRKLGHSHFWLRFALINLMFLLFYTLQPVVGSVVPHFHRMCSLKALATFMNKWLHVVNKSSFCIGRGWSCNTDRSKGISLLLYYDKLLLPFIVTWLHVCKYNRYLLYWDGTTACVTGFHTCNVYTSLHEFQAVAFDHPHGSLTPWQWR
jgi:hypothetical protein